MDGQNPYSDVYETLSEVLATQAIPRGGAAKISFASYILLQTGDSERALLCGRASVAILCLEHAIRDIDSVKQRRVLSGLEVIFEQWVAIPLAEAGIFVPCELAA